MWLHLYSIVCVRTYVHPPLNILYTVYMVYSSYDTAKCTVTQIKDTSVQYISDEDLNLLELHPEETLCLLGSGKKTFTRS